jgi:hypothetical protein
MSENENDFERLRRLLALKRHEIPPPGYFENFSSQIVGRIRAGETGASEGFVLELPWLVRLLSAFEVKPAYTGAFASALCLLLVFGIVLAERSDSAPRPLLPQSAQADVGGILLATASPSDLTAQSSVQPELISLSNTNPAVYDARPASLLLARPAATVQPLTFPISNN